LRDTFENIHQLMDYYRFLKIDVSSQGSPIPHKIKDLKSGEWYQMPRYFNAWAARKSIEDKYAFNCDVESYVAYYHKQQTGYVIISMEFLLPIFHLRYSPETAKYKSYRHMAQCIRSRIVRGERIPRRLKYDEHISRIASDMNEKIEEYFIKKGMIKE
jgi:hypothetical protein